MMNYSDCAQIAAFPQILPSDLSTDEHTLLMTLVHSSEFESDHQLMDSSLALAIATFSRPIKILQCSFEELLQLSTSLDFIAQRLGTSPTLLVCQKRRQQVSQEIQQRKLRFEKLRSRLDANLQQIQSLNVQLYDRVFAKINFELLLDRVLDGDETMLQQELSSYHALIHQFYEDLTLRHLAPIACQKRRFMQKTRRIELFYEYLPVLSLIVTTVFLHFWLTWTWGLIAAMFIVGPMMICVAHPKRCALRDWAKQTLATQQNKIVQGRSDLTTEESQVLNLLFLTVERQA